LIYTIDYVFSGQRNPLVDSPAPDQKPIPQPTPVISDAPKSEEMLAMLARYNAIKN
jgi:hypothetical protein